MPDRPQITVAIPTFNGSRHLPDLIRSVLAQEGVAFDLLVSDDRSDDDTTSLVRLLAGDRARVVVNSERLGLAGNWNRCVALTETPLAAVVHQDDLLRPGHLAAHAAAFTDGPTVGLAASASGVVDDLGREAPASVVGRGGLGPVDRTFAPGEVLPFMAAGNPLRCSAVSIRRAAHADVGGFDPAWRYAVDFDFWLRVCRRWSLAWIASPTVDVRWHVRSETHRFKTGTADLEEVERLTAGLVAELKRSQTLSRRFEKAGRRALAGAYLNRAHEAVRGGDGRLARRCLTRSLRVAPGVLGAILADPRLAAQMAAVWAAPTRAGRWFHRPA